MPKSIPKKKAIAPKIHEQQMSLFDYFELDESKNSNVNSDEVVAENLFLSQEKSSKTPETHAEPTEKKLPVAEKIHEEISLRGNKKTDYYLFHSENIAALTRDTLSLIKEQADNYVICADVCHITKKHMKEWNVTFRKMPRDFGLLPEIVKEKIREIKPEYEVKWRENEAFLQNIKDISEQNSTENTETSAETLLNDFIEFSGIPEKNFDENIAVSESPKSQKSPQIDYSANFKITDENLGVGGAKTKFKYNIEAIELANILTAENRNATPEEQEILSKYVGFGAMPNVFDEKKSDWKNERERLKQAVSEDEYRSLAGSTLNAHYTSPAVIEAIFNAVQNFGAPENVRILEPAMGVGNFFGMLPESLKNARLHGVELDSVTSKIARKLYPYATIENCGFEQSKIKNNTFDLAVGNVPFGSYNIIDPDHKKDWLIHDAFFRKSLDKVAAGGIIAFISSKGTLDKSNPTVREYLAERAELIGAIRLPNTAFKANAGTEVTSDIIFLQKRECPIDISTKTPDWCFVGRTSDGVPCNQYFLDNPDMVLGTMVFDHRLYGNNSETACVPFENSDLKVQLQTAISNLSAQFNAEIDLAEPEDFKFEAPLEARNFTHFLVDGEVYFKNHSDLEKVKLSQKELALLKDILPVRDDVRRLINAQVENCSDEILSRLQAKLTRSYDEFIAKNGYLSTSAVKKVFGDDDDIYILQSLEILNKETKKIEKADIFTKRTIQAEVKIVQVESPQEALFISLDQTGRVDLDYMSEICGFSEDEIIADLIENNEIYFDPARQKYVETAEYLSGNVREKLRLAEIAVAQNPAFSVFGRNVNSLKNVIPKDIPTTEISVRVGVNWIENDDYAQFLNEICGLKIEKTYVGDVPPHDHLTMLNRAHNGEYSFKNPRNDHNFYSVSSTSTFGTPRMNVYDIFENMLNQRDCVVRDPVKRPDGNVNYVINAKETIAAQSKKNILEEKFADWIWADQARREKYTQIYNERFNCLVGRKYDGSRQVFVGMSPNIKFRSHQSNAVARTKFGGNTLLSHVVGGGKTFEYVAATMEKKRMGLINKAAVVTPKALVSQTAIEWQRLYPNAKLLVATAKDFTKENRNKFMARLTTGNYDAVIMSQEQWAKIPMSLEFQTQFLKDEVARLGKVISDLKASGNEMSVKQHEIAKKKLEAKIKKKVENVQRDTAIEFEQTGIDFLVVDEAHGYKNGLITTKIQNVNGVSSRPSDRAEDMLMKCSYLNEKSNYSNIIFATGTPISNNLSELYTMSMYLRPDLMTHMGVENFDDWAATFARVNVESEQSVKGGYKPKARLNEFVNLPELVQLYHTFADVKNAEDLQLPTPKLATGKPIAVVCPPSPFQEKYIEYLALRAQNIPADKRVDNILKINTEARWLGLDARAVSPKVPQNPYSKADICVNNLMKIYEETAEKRGVQAVFCDLAVNSTDGRFSVYEEIKNQLISRGIPENEICFARDAKDENQKTKLLEQLNSGEKRFVISSTAKFGTGANFQERLAAVHHLDIPYKPSEIEQRNGRILRQGNTFPEVKILNYLTERTLDSYLIGIIVNKQKFISQLMSGKSTERTCKDLDQAVINAAEFQALASGDPRVKEKIDLERELGNLRSLRNSFRENIFRLESLQTTYKSKIANCQADLPKAKNDAEKVVEDPKFVIDGKIFEDRKDVGNALELEIAKAKNANGEEISIGKIGEFDMSLRVYHVFEREKIDLKIKGDLNYSVELETKNQVGNVTRILNAYGKIPKKFEELDYAINVYNTEISEVEKGLAQSFPKEDEYKEKSARLAELIEIFRAESQKNDKSIAEKDSENETENGEEILDEPTVSFDKNSIEKILSSLENFQFSEVQKDNFALFKTFFPEILNGKISEKTLYFENTKSQKSPITVTASPYNFSYIEMVENDKVFNFFVDEKNEILTPSQSTKDENLADFLEQIALNFDGAKIEVIDEKTADFDDISESEILREVQEKQEKSLENYAKNMAQKLENSKNNMSDKEEIQPQKFTPAPTILEDFVDMSQYRKVISDEQINELFEIKALSENTFEISPISENEMPFEPQKFDLTKAKNGEIIDNSRYIRFVLQELSTAVRDTADADKILEIARGKCGEFGVKSSLNPVLSEEDLAKIASNDEEDIKYKNAVENLLESKEKDKSIVICKTPYSLKIVGLEELDITISYNTLKKVTALTQDVDVVHPHGLTKSQVNMFPKFIRIPAMILKSNDPNRPNSHILITDQTDHKGDLIMAVIAPDRKGNQETIHMFVTAYGRENMHNFLKNYIENTPTQILAYNKEKTDGILQQVRLLSSNETFDDIRPSFGATISFDNSIAYNLSSVKGFDEKNLKNILEEKTMNANTHESPENATEKSVGTLTFRDSGEVMEFYNADELLSAYKREISSIGPENVQYDVADEDLKQQLHAAYLGEYGADISNMGTREDDFLREKSDKDLNFVSHVAEKYGIDITGEIEEMRNFQPVEDQLPTGMTSDEAAQYFQNMYGFSADMARNLVAEIEETFGSLEIKYEEENLTTREKKQLEKEEKNFEKAENKEAFREAKHQERTAQKADVPFTQTTPNPNSPWMQKVAAARSADLVAYFERNANFDTERIGNGASQELRVKGYGGLNINVSTGEWYCHSTKIGGRNSVDCLTKVLNTSFKEAVEELAGRYETPFPKPKVEQPKPELTQFSMPERATDSRRVIAFLTKTRSIPAEVVIDLIKRGELYQQAKTGNAVFVHKDKNGVPVGAELQGTSTMRNGEPIERFKGVAKGTHSTCYEVKFAEIPKMVYVFESAIDLASFMEKCRGSNNYETLRAKEASLISMNGLKDNAIQKYVAENPTVAGNVVSCVDNDGPGQAFNLRNGFDKNITCQKLLEVLKVNDVKDWNELLQFEKLAAEQSQKVEPAKENSQENSQQNSQDLTAPNENFSKAENPPVGDFSEDKNDISQQENSVDFIDENENYDYDYDYSEDENYEMS